MVLIFNNKKAKPTTKQNNKEKNTRTHVTHGGNHKPTSEATKQKTTKRV